LKLDKLVLASSSPRRKDLIKALGIPFLIFEPNVDETVNIAKPEELTQIAIRKVRAFPGNDVAVAADTAVVYDDRLLGKPANEEDAFKMLLSLRGKAHLVITAVAVMAQNRVSSSYCMTQVTMRNYTEDEIRTYIASGKARDKAGGYAIQDKDFNPVASYEGCYLNVVGLPLCPLVQIIKELGFCLISFSKPAECQGCQSKDKL